MKLGMANRNRFGMQKLRLGPMWPDTCRNDFDKPRLYMSRFYDALKEAGRSRGVAEENPVQGDWEAEGPVVREVPARVAATDTEGTETDPEPITREPKSEALHADLLHLAGIP